MAMKYSPQIVQDGLRMCVDASSIKSVRGQRSLLGDWSTWTAGLNGCTGYSANQTVAGETGRALGTDPFGNTSMLWQTYPSGDSNGDGGWDGGTNVTVDPAKLYRHSVWMRRTSATTGGNYYFGCHTNGTGDTYQMQDGASNTNPYWACGNIGGLTQNVWYLFVGHIYPYNTTRTTQHPDTAYYTISGGRIGSIACNIGTGDIKFHSDATTMYSRVYHYYCTETTSHMEFWQPRIDLCDGSEPSVADMLANNVGSNWMDLRNNYGGLLQGPTYDSSGHFEFGAASICSFPSLAATYTEMTVIAWVNPSSYGGYRAIFQGTNTSDAAFYLYNNNNTPYLYPYSAAGWTIPNSSWSQVGFSGNAVSLNHIKNGTQSYVATGLGTILTCNYFHISGQSTSDTSENFQGAIAHFEFYNRVLSSAEVLQNYNSLKGRFGL